jgi:hypothetical protein
MHNFRSFAIHSLDKFCRVAAVIVAKRSTYQLYKVQNKVCTRDLSLW